MKTRIAMILAACCLITSGCAYWGRLVELNTNGKLQYFDPPAPLFGSEELGSYYEKQYNEIVGALMAESDKKCEGLTGRKYWVMRGYHYGFVIQATKEYERVLHNSCMIAYRYKAFDYVKFLNKQKRKASDLLIEKKKEREYIIEQIAANS